jgi:hypothetical protein
MPKKELQQIYGGGRKPRLAHNSVMHTDVTRHGERGFRRFGYRRSGSVKAGPSVCADGTTATRVMQ